MLTFNKICIIIKPNLSPDSELMLLNLIPWLHRRKKTIYFLEQEKDRLKKMLKVNYKLLHFIPAKLLSDKVDLVITLGGDGTLIGACRRLTKSKPPVFGVNMGHLGFITEFSVDEFYSGLESTLKGAYELTKLSLYQVDIIRKNKTLFTGYFLNDVVIHNSHISRMLKLSVSANKEHIYNLSGDGLIISSPIGSTAYSMAAGGPIIHPLVKTIALTPICAHSLTHRPLVVPDDSVIELFALKGTDTACVTLDGQEVKNVLAQDIIKITRSKTKTVRFIKNSNRTYFNTLKEKLSHGAREIK
jgi:NAD+ kinase